VSSQVNKHKPQLESDNNYTYPQFVIDEKTGRVEVNFIDWASGRVVRHIPAAELTAIIRDHGLISGIQFQ
jgi:uncharacterized FlaG/YvyC family protein